MHQYRLPEESLLIFEQIIEHSANAIFLVDDGHRLTFANQHGETLFQRLVAAQLLDNALLSQEQVIEINDGQHPRYIRTHSVATEIQQHAAGHLFIGTDITAEMTAQRQEAHMRHRLEQTLELTDEGFWFWDIPSGLISHNQCWSRIFGFTDRQLHHHESEVFELVHPEDAERVKQTLTRHLRGETPTYVCEYRIIVRGDETRWIINHGKVVRHNDEGRSVEMLGKTQDITEKKEREQEMHNLAWHDPLTQLENRPRFYQKVEQARQQSMANNDYLALLYLDLNRFKEVNDSLGHNAGDLLLKEVAQRLRSTIRGHDAIARLGGDEFAILVNCLGNSHQEAKGKLIVLANRLLDSLSREIEIAGNTVSISSSIGMYLFKDDTTPVAEMLHKADMAQYYSKNNHRKWMIWSDRLRAEQSQRDTIETGLRRALDNGEFYLEYQPQYSRGGEVASLEALLRWRTPDGKIIAPATFIPVAENSGLILNISEWVLEQTCRQLKLWQSQPLFDALRVSVNISPRQLRRTDFIKSVEQVLTRSGINPQQLSFEMLETALTDNMPDAQRKLNILKEMKINIALDNFGTGMASLTGLRKLAIDEVKIDRSFVFDMTENDDFLITIRGIVAMCQALNINIVAEGVEKPAQFAALSDMGCHRFQGWLFSRARSPEQLNEILQRRGL
ncbi:EAL domain-containing protein [Paramixta manurensis]|uniref:EAL domain-containing protein n=1 Tax=Paramixta manurensis TaxID=2740817 RepID=A0A6M8UAK1_9GAMM|nr:EAL domain-containing protein [Erwiniaceae bacterium PD-1]